MYYFFVCNAFHLDKFTFDKLGQFATFSTLDVVWNCVAILHMNGVRQSISSGKHRARGGEKLA